MTNSIKSLQIKKKLNGVDEFYIIDYISFSRTFHIGDKTKEPFFFFVLIKMKNKSGEFNIFFLSHRNCCWFCFLLVLALQMYPLHDFYLQLLFIYESITSLNVFISLVFIQTFLLLERVDLSSSASSTQSP